MTIQRPPCERDPRLFSSPLLADHEEARTWCAGCPAAFFDACKQQAKAERHNDGTWHGVLYANGKPSPKGKRWAMDRAARMAIEDSMFTEDEARIAHAAWGRGIRDDRARIGERVYQRIRARRQRERRAA